ncbi:MAG TPA: PAS domain-containing protein, partial [Bacteroidetes bacterium]|nr:sensory histidine kinase AtoS [bacterium BMS3Bbin04]HDO65307.1 PAS domain-containing protein [Bacteroidota bacterium]HEX04432.1 PAS domain-containing protein [Bacteroidota bacterium]
MMEKNTLESQEVASKSSTVSSLLQPSRKVDILLRRIDHMAEASLIVDPDGRIVTVNREAGRLFQMDPDKMLDERVSDYLLVNDDQLLMPDEQLLMDDYGYPLIVAMRSDHSFFLAQMRGVRIMINEIERVFLMISDASLAAQKSEERVRKIQQDSVNVILNTLAHEINNPLMIIQAISDSMRLGFISENSRDRSLRQIIEQVRRINAALEQLRKNPDLKEVKYHGNQNVYQLHDIDNPES